MLAYAVFYEIFIHTEIMIFNNYGVPVYNNELLGFQYFIKLYCSEHTCTYNEIVSVELIYSNRIARSKSSFHFQCSGLLPNCPLETLAQCASTYSVRMIVYDTGADSRS